MSFLVTERWHVGRQSLASTKKLRSSFRRAGHFENADAKEYRDDQDLPEPLSLDFESSR